MTDANDMTRRAAAATLAARHGEDHPMRAATLTKIWESLIAALRRLEALARGKVVS